MANLLNWRETLLPPPPIWEPQPLTHAQWPPDYEAIWRWRAEMLIALQDDEELLAAAKAYYSTRPKEFIMHWMDTYDPRREGSKWIPFVFFIKQAEFIDFLQDLREQGENGLCEKCRDAGVSWLGCGYSIWSWLFIPDDSIGWGSRKEGLVDTLGDVDSLFEKMRKILERLPSIWLPVGFAPKKHSTFMKFINPENGATITGEAGDNIGRGGRKAMYFKDEAAHYERPEKIEAALGDNTNSQVDISSVNGLGNPFHRRREAGVQWESGKDIAKGFTRIFIFDWRDHPAKTLEWYNARKAKYEREGMAHIFAQEVDRNYSAAVSNTIISYEWIQSAVDAHLKIAYVKAMIEREGIPDVWMAGLDVADGGIDRNALAKRQWIIWRDVEEWGERDTGVTARRAIVGVRQHKGVKIQYDCVGLGSGVKSEYNRLTQDELLENVPEMVPWNAGGSVLEPFNRIIPNDDESALNRDFYGNLKAQAWWNLRSRFYKTHKAVTDGAVYPVEELISLDSTMPLLQQLMKELAQPVRAQNGQLKTIVDKQPEGTKSPNLADAGMMMYFPLPDDWHTVTVGTYG